MTMERIDDDTVSPEEETAEINAALENLPTDEEESTTPVPEPTGLVTPPPPAVDPEMMQLISRYQEYERQDALRQQQAARDEVEQAAQRRAAQYREELEAQGHYPDQAKAIAGRLYQSQLENERQKQSFQAQLGETKAKNDTVQYFAKKYGVEPGSLARYDSPDTMEAFAQGQQRISALEAEVTKMKQAEVPPSEYDNNRSAGSAKGGYGAKLEALANKEDWTPTDYKAYAALVGL